MYLDFYERPFIPVYAKKHLLFIVRGALPRDGRVLHQTTKRNRLSCRSTTQYCRHEFSISHTHPIRNILVLFVADICRALYCQLAPGRILLLAQKNRQPMYCPKNWDRNYSSDLSVTNCRTEGQHRGLIDADGHVIFSAVWGISNSPFALDCRVGPRQAITANFRNSAKSKRKRWNSNYSPA
jgi:hypothetical protein